MMDTGMEGLHGKEKECSGPQSGSPSMHRMRRAKKELVRVIRTPEDEITIDFTGKKNGRGAYICNSMECLKMARKKKSLERSLKMTIPEEVYEELEKEMMDGE